MKVTVNVSPLFMLPELKVDAPEGTDFDVTVCGAVESLSVHITVLFTPMTTVITAGL